MKTENIACEYIMHMGDDVNVVDNARVSFDSENLAASPGSSSELSEKDASLIRFLATGFRKSEWNEMIQAVRNMSDLEIHLLFLKLRRHAAHWAPMAHPHIQVRITAPIFLARQYVKHQIGLVWSEVSRRYVDHEPTFWFPNEWRARPVGGIKQGSSSTPVLDILSRAKTDVDGGYGLEIGMTTPQHVAENVTSGALTAYLDMIEGQVAPELARIVLPQNMMVTWRWTGSLAAFARVCQQRCDPHAQREAQALGKQINYIVEPLFPVSWDAMVGDCVGHLL